jgi:hypothetical protein
VKRLSHWWWRLYSQPQWLVERHKVRFGAHSGWRPRIVLSRALCLFYRWDLRQVPKARRNKALQQQVQLYSPFLSSNYYVRWHGAEAEVWIWDHALLLTRLPPESQHCKTIIPDSILAPVSLHDERKLVGLDSVEWQSWRGGRLVDSRLVGDEIGDEQCDVSMRIPLQPADLEWITLILASFFGAGLLVSLLFQAGVALSHWQGLTQLEENIAIQDESIITQQQAKIRAERFRQQFIAKGNLLQSNRVELVNAMLLKMPLSVTRIQQLELRPERIEMTLQDDKPDPKGYVEVFEGLNVSTFYLQNVQIQLSGNAGLIRFVADVRSKVGSHE